MTDFTPGPWGDSNRDTSDERHDIVASDGRVIATLTALGTGVFDDWTSAEVRANARAIAAVPELVAACENALGIIRAYGVFCNRGHTSVQRGHHDTLFALEAVLAKVKGGNDKEKPVH